MKKENMYILAAGSSMDALVASMNDFSEDGYEAIPGIGIVKEVDSDGVEMLATIMKMGVIKTDLTYEVLQRPTRHDLQTEIDGYSAQQPQWKLLGPVTGMVSACGSEIFIATMFRNME